jgi:hypothetical protein
VSYQVSWRGEMAQRELQPRPNPRHPIRWLALTTADGEPATRIDLDPQNPTPVAYHRDPDRAQPR